MYVSKHTYSDLLCGEEISGSIVKQGFKYGVMDRNTDFQENIKSSHYHIENISKPLRAFSGYSSQELQEICKKMDIPFDKKKIMYEAICQKID